MLTPLFRQPSSRMLPLAVTLALAGCADHRSLTAPAERALGAAYVEGSTFTLAPSGGDDTDALRAAIASAQAAGPGSTVALAEGVFHVRNFALTGFRGALRGAGRGRTVLQAVAGLNARLLDINDGAVTLADLTFDATLPNALAMFLRVNGTSVATHIERVAFVGNGDRPMFGIFYGGAARYLQAVGSHELYESSFDGVPYPVATTALDSRFVMGAPGRGNRITGAIFGVMADEASGGSVDIAYNEIEALAAGIRVWHGYMWEMHPPFGYPPLRAATFRVAHNEIRVSGEADAIFVRDASAANGGPPLATVLVEHNDIQTDIGCVELGICGGIGGGGASGVVVRANRIRGRADAGIYLGLFGPDERWLVLGNDVQGVSSVLAPVLLGEASRGITVVGGDGRSNVLDFGSGNVVTGADALRGAAPGPTIRGALWRKLQLIVPTTDE